MLVSRPSPFRRLCIYLRWVSLILGPLVFVGALLAAILQPGVESQPWLVSARVALASISPLFLGLALLHIGRCFHLFSLGLFFESGATASLRAFSFWCFWSSIASLLTPTALSLLESLTKAAGERHLELSVSSGAVFSLLISGLVWIVAEVLTKARELEEENSQFI